MAGVSEELKLLHYPHRSGRSVPGALRSDHFQILSRIEY
jgi:hypothetical protein